MSCIMWAVLTIFIGSGVAVTVTDMVERRRAGLRGSSYFGAWVIFVLCVFCLAFLVYLFAIGCPS